MSAPTEAPKSAEVAKPSAGHAPDAAVVKTADATHAAVAEAAKPAKSAKEVLVEFQGAKDAAARKAVIEHLHLSPEEAKDATLQKSFKDAAHGDHDVEAAIDKKFHDAANAKAEAAHAAPEAPKKEAKAHAAEEKKHAPEHADGAHEKDHPEDHAEEASHAPDVSPAVGAHAAGHGHAEDKPGLTKRFLKNTFWELPKSVLQPVKATAQTGWEIAKGGWAMFRGLFSKKYREETYSNPPVPLKAKKAANDDKEVHHEKHAA